MMRKETQSRDQEIQQIGSFSSFLVHRSEERAGARPDLQGPEPAGHRAGNDRGPNRLQHGPGGGQGEGGSSAGCEGGGVQEVLASLLRHFRAGVHHHRLYSSQSPPEEGAGIVSRDGQVAFGCCGLFVLHLSTYIGDVLRTPQSKEGFRNRLPAADDSFSNILFFIMQQRLS